MSRADVQAMLDRSVIAFDRSVEVYQMPRPYGFTIRPHLRPYLASESYLMLQNDASDAEKPLFAAQLQAMHAALGNTIAQEWAERVDTAERLVQEIYRAADALVALHPE